MQANIGREVAALKRMTVKELRGRYLEVFGEEARSGNKDFLWKRIAWRIQVNAGGGPGKTRRAMGQRAPLLLVRGRYHGQDAGLDGFRQVRPGGGNCGQVGRQTRSASLRAGFGDVWGVLVGALKGR